MQLSPIQCTYSNIFIRFFKFFPANTNIYQNSYRVIGVLCGLRQGVLSSQCGYLISFGTKYLMSLQCGFPSGRLPRCARNDKVLRAEGNHIQKPTQNTLRYFKKELIKISIQFVCKLQSIIIPYTKVNRSLFPYHMHLYLYLLKRTYYI